MDASRIAAAAAATAARNGKKKQGLNGSLIAPTLLGNEKGAPGESRAALLR